MSEDISDDWIRHHFDIHAPELGKDLYRTLARARSLCPVAHTDQRGGYWVVTRYRDVLRVARDFRTFSSELGITPPRADGRDRPPMKILPVTIDPPLQREFRRVINPYFTPAVVAGWEQPTRTLVNRLIDGFIERGECDFMAEFARPLPGLAFFDLALHAPPDDLEQVNEWATKASVPDEQESRDGLMKLAKWIGGFVARRRQQPPHDDVVDAVMNATIEGRPITDQEVVGTIHLLIQGGLETTAGVLGMAMLRFCQQPELPQLLRTRPEVVPDAVEELLRLDGSFVCIGRTTREATELGGQELPAGERVMMYWASANRDPEEFERPDEFDHARARNRHLAFGAGPHRCAGSNLARMNLRIALEELVRRLHDIELQPGPIEWHSATNRAPRAVPIRFRPGSREPG